MPSASGCRIPRSRSTSSRARARPRTHECRFGRDFHVRKWRVAATCQRHNVAMSLDATACYRALATHDRRFDGRFYVGVATTRIYCRPVCTVRTPRAEHCRFFASAAAAEQEGFRPCLRCRPELAPGNAAIDSSERLAHAAIGLIENGALEAGGLDSIAARLGVTARHLRRVFATAFGVSPVAFAQ